MPWIEFAAPEWLALWPFTLAAAWYFRRRGLWRPLRLALVTLGFLILAEPRLRWHGGAMDLWLLVDRSASVASTLEPRRAEMESLLARARRGEDRLFVVDFSDVALLRGGQEGALFPGRPDETCLASAMRYALGQVSRERPTRILVLSDGYSTEPLTGLAERLAAQGVPLDHRLVTPPAERDVRLERLTLPERVQAGEPFLIEAQLTAPQDGVVAMVVRRDGRPLGRGQARVEQGRGVLRLTDRIDAGGAYEYSVTADVSDDPVPGNNSAAAWVVVEAPPHLLLVTSYPQDPVAAALRAQGEAVEVVTEPGSLSPGRLSGTRAVILNNVPAFRMPRDFLEALDAYVRVQGQGFMMIGGRWSFGSGGYFASPADALLPVSLELKQEHRKLVAAVAIVLDRSGSMAADVGNGQAKMDLANEGAARSIELLGDQDLLTVFAIDSTAHWVVALGSIGGSRRQIDDQVRRIGSAGGGIFVYTGLKAAWEELKHAPYGQRHIILFADAADSEEPGEYVKLLAEMQAARATVSVIGLGSESDTDAGFLRDVAARGQGRVFFARDAAELPALFAQETVALARSAFLADPVGVRSTSGWREIAAQALSGLSEVDAYNLSYLRPDASAALLTRDEFEAPLVAYWQRGAGRVAAVCFPLAGELSSRVRGWAQYGDFAETLTRWLKGEEQPPGIAVRTHVEGTSLTVELISDESWQAALAASPPVASLVSRAAAPAQTLTWERLRPGRLVARTPIAPGQSYRGAVHIGRTTLPFGPIAGPLSAEWSFDNVQRQALLALAAGSGGQARDDLGTAWEAPSRSAAHELRLPLLVVFLALYLAEILLDRLGFTWPKLGLAHIAGTRARDGQSAPPSRELTATAGLKEAPAPGRVEIEPEAKAPTPAPSAAERRAARYRRAKDAQR